MGHELLISQSDSDGSNIIQEGKNRASLTFSANNLSSLVSLTDDGLGFRSKAEPTVQHDGSATGLSRRVEQGDNAANTKTTGLRSLLVVGEQIVERVQNCKGCNA